MLENRLNDKVAKLVVYQDFDALERDSNEVLLPLTLSNSDAVLDDLAAVLVTGNVREVLHYGVVDYRSPLVSFEQIQALAQDMVASDVATQVENPATLEGLLDQTRRALSSLFFVDKFVFEEHLESSCSMDIHGDLAEFALN